MKIISTFFLLAMIVSSVVSHSPSSANAMPIPISKSN